jgi:predicted metal-dependent peptidase
MIEKQTFSSEEALRLVQDALLELVMRAELVGLVLLGSAIRIKQAPPTVTTMATDGQNIWVSPQWLMKNGLRGNTFDLLHEWLHCFLNHTSRRGDRDPHVWNEACDMVVVRMASETLSSQGDYWPPPSDGVIPEGWSRDLTAEEIYDKLMSLAPPPPPAAGGTGQNRDADGQSSHLNSTDLDYESAALRANSAGEDEFLSNLMDDISMAQTIVEMSGKQRKYPKGLWARVTEILRGSVPWGRLLLGDMVDSLSQEFATWSPPRRKYYPHLLLPSYQSLKSRKLVIGVDVSASVSGSLLSQFKANVAAAAARADETVVVTFDEVVREVIRTRHPTKILDKLKLVSGSHSHTSTLELFDIVDQVNPSSIGILTDAHVVFPTRPYPQTLWVIPRHRAGRPPWGKVYLLEESW